MRPLRTVSVLPTMFTLGNLVCGFFAIVVAARVDVPDPSTTDPTDWTNCMISACLILLAMVFDALDGQVARLARSDSEFGAQLDSLCDVVSFGVAPAFLLVKICPNFTYLHREQVWLIAAAFVACAALRLARFSVETTEEDDHMVFRGLPSPAAAGTVASFAIMFYTLRRAGGDLRLGPQADDLIQGMLPFYTLLIALLMVSPVPYPHLINQWARGKRSFGHVVLLLFSVLTIALFWTYAFPLVMAVFVTVPAVQWVYAGFLRRRWGSRLST